MSTVLLIIGAALVVAGVAAIYWPAALILAGVFLLAHVALDDYSKAAAMKVPAQSEPS